MADRDLTQPRPPAQAAPGRRAAAPVAGCPRQRRGTTPADDRPLPRLRRARRNADTWDEATAAGRAGAAGAARPAAVLHRRGGADAARVLRRRARRRTPSRGCRWPRWSTTSSPPAASTATATPTCRDDPRHLAAGAARARRDARRSATAPTASPRCDALAARGDRRRVLAGASWPAARGTSSNVSAGVVGVHARRSWPRSTPTRGRGTRSASAARPTREGSCASGPVERRASRTSARARPTRTRCASHAELAERHDLRGLLKGVGRPAGQRLALPARRPPPRPARRGHDARATRDDDEVDLVIVGAGAGGSVLAQRLARQGLADRDPRGGPVLAPRRGLGLRRGGLARSCTGRRSGSSAAPTRSSWARTTPAAASAARWSTTPATRPRFHPSRLRDLHPRRRRRRLADLLRGPAAALRAGRARAAGGRPGLAVGRPAPLPVLPAPGHRRRGEAVARARSSWASRCGSGPVGIVNGTFGNRPHCIYRGYCLQGCKVNAKASPYVTHLPDALAHGVEIRADCMALRVEIDDATGRARGVVYVRESDGVRAPAARRVRWRWPATRSRRPGCC